MGWSLGSLPLALGPEIALPSAVLPSLQPWVPRRLPWLRPGQALRRSHCLPSVVLAGRVPRKVRGPLSVVEAGPEGLRGCCLGGHAKQAECSASTSPSLVSACLPAASLPPIPPSPVPLGLVSPPPALQLPDQS